MKRLSRTVLAVLFAAGAAVVVNPARGEEPKGKPATASATQKPAKRTGTPPELAKAVAEITKEYTDFAAKPDSGKLRSKSEYFPPGKLPEDTTVEDVVSIIEKSMSGPPTQIAYVKWQLLSGCPGKFDAEQSKRMLSAYRAAPQPVPRFSVDPATHPLLDKMLIGLKEGQETKINSQIDAEHKKVDPYNEPIIAYRDDLYHRLPMTGDTLVARLQDGYGRVKAGILITNFLKEYETDIHQWTTVGATIPQAQMVLGAMKDAGTFKGTETYTEINYNEKNKTFSWRKPIATFAERPPKTGLPTNLRIEKLLQDYINNPKGGEIKFKDK